VGLVQQPYRVAGRRSPAPAAQLDTAWLAVVAALGAPLPPASDRVGGRSSGSGPLPLGVGGRSSGSGPLPLFVGGRSSGARVACRTAAQAGAAGVICLAFPLHPPGRPEKTRLPELEAVAAPVLIIQGERDPFGMPPASAGREIVVIAGGHSLKAKEPVRDAVSEWLASQL
jgi:predicted alpha/beta-hydrolase family hydrolase